MAGQIQLGPSSKVLVDKAKNFELFSAGKTTTTKRNSFLNLETTGLGCFEDTGRIIMGNSR